MNTLLSAETALLHALYAGPGYGQELIEGAKLRSRGRLRLGPGNGYPALARLVKRGLARAWEVRRSTGRPRRYLELTPAGIERVLGERRLLAELLGLGAGGAQTPRESQRMAAAIDDCDELSGLAASLRTQLRSRR